MEYKNVLLKKTAAAALITINRPDKLNALNSQTIAELSHLFSALETDNEVRCIILTGSGEKAFVAGADISELNKLRAVEGKKFAEDGQHLFNMIENFSKPVIAAVNGFALGGGCELAMACHIRYASENAKFGQPEVNLGIIPGFGGTQRLTKLINSGRALELILTGDSINADEAYRLGLVNKILPQNGLLEACYQLAEKIAQKPSVAVKLAIQSVLASGEMTRAQGLKMEAALFGLCCSSDDFKEGTSAFLEKRKANFTNS
jgi:enoyl-CoA hydratase